MKNQTASTDATATIAGNIATLSFADRMRRLMEKKLAVTQEKIDREGGMDEGDYGRHVAPENFHWQVTPNHADGSFYGFTGWTRNFESLLSAQPVYVNPHDALAGQTYFYLSKMKTPASAADVAGGVANPKSRKTPGAVGYVWNPDFDYSHLKSFHEKYNITHGIGADAHYACDLAMGLRLGWGGILEKLRRHRALHGRDKALFYECEERTVLAIQGWIRRTVAEIDRRLLTEPHPQLRENLRVMKAVNEWIAAGGAPRTLREACQWLAWFVLAKRTYNRCGAGGQLDELLRPYYERDATAGLIDDKEGAFTIACLLLIDAQYYQLGGPGPDGRDMTSRVSHLILDAAELMDGPCNLTIRVHDGLDPELLRRGVRLLFHYKKGWPRFSGDKALVAGFMRAGYSEELARQRIAVGCNWMSLPGLEYTLNDVVKVNLAKVFEIAWLEMFASTAEPDLERLWESYLRHLRVAVEKTADGNHFHMCHQAHNEPELVTNLLCHGPVETGLDMTAGGARYCNLAIDGAGIAVVADSFAALEQRVVDEDRLTWDEVRWQLEKNFPDIEGESVRLLLQGSERFGQATDNRAERWAVRISRAWSGIVRDQNRRYPEYNFIPGLFSWANTIEFGKAVGATPNGRRAGQPVNHGANPLPGFRKDGAVTALVNAIAAVQPGYGNTAPVQLELDPIIGESPEAIEKIIALIKTMFDQGCTLLNINLVDEARVLEAHKDPSKFPDLVVRVTGFTSYFSMLSPQFRQLVVDRILSKRKL
ncbi:pyruvate formate lyase family protein [Termitidicoccus mucosus]